MRVSIQSDKNAFVSPLGMNFITGPINSKLLPERLTRQHRNVDGEDETAARGSAYV